MNAHLRLPLGLPAKLEHAYLNVDIEQSNLDAPLYIFFRALNFSDDGEGHESSEGCLSLYMEIEFNT